MDKIEVLTLVNQNNESMGQFVKYEDYCKLQSDYDEVIQLLKEAESTNKDEDYYNRRKESIDINWHYNEIPQEPYAELYLIELTSPKGVLEFAEFIPQSLFHNACFNITRSGEHSGKIGLKYIARWCILKPGKILEHNNTVSDEIKSNLLKLLTEN